MKALVVEEFGDSSKLKYSETTKPVPAEGEVSIEKLYINEYHVIKLIPNENRSKVARLALCLHVATIKLAARKY